MHDESAGGQRYPWPALLILAVELFFGVYGQALLRLSLWLQVLVMLGTLGFVAAVVAVRRPPSPGPPFRRFFEALRWLTLGALRWLRRAAPGIAAGALVFAGMRLVSGIGACDLPTHLSVVTAPESVPAVTDAANRYVAESGGGCRNVTITVTANSSLTDLRQAFANGWLKPGSTWQNPGSSLPQTPGAAAQPALSIGPRPDIWIPDSRLAAEDVVEFIKNQNDQAPGAPWPTKAALDIGETVGTSPMVVAVFTTPDERPASGAGLSDLLGNLRSQQGVKTLVRSSPDGSEAALLSTPALYQALEQGAEPAADDAEAEKRLNQRGVTAGAPTTPPVPAKPATSAPSGTPRAGGTVTLQAGDTASLLCQFHAADSRGESPPPGTAFIVPEKILAAYGAGVALGTNCPSMRPRNWRLSVYRADDLPMLDHPFVSARWPGEYSERRQQVIDDFRQWLGSDQLGGFRTGTGEIASPDLTAAPAAGRPPSELSVNNLHEGGGASAPPQAVEHHAPGGRPDCVRTLQQALDCYDRARPSTSFSLLLDISGSMSQQTMGEPKLAWVQDVARRAVSGARVNDVIRVRAFSARRPAPPAAVAVHDADQLNALQTQVQQMTVSGQDLPLTEAIGTAARELTPGAQNIVMLTDGEVTRNNPQVVARARTLAAQLREGSPDLRIFFVLTGPVRCADQPIKPVVDALGQQGSCIDRSAKAVGDVADELMSSIRWRAS